MPFANPSRLLRWLKVSLVAGALYDLAFAAQIVLMPELATRLLGLQPPAEAYFLWLIAIFLGMLGGIYLLAAYDPSAYSGNILIAIAGRWLGAAMFLYASLDRPDLWGLQPLAAADFAFGLAHAALWLPIRKAFAH
jgi:hypothetical protein